MGTGNVEIICGNGSGKTAGAFGRAFDALIKRKTVIMIQFLKGSQKQEELDIIKRLEPELKVFRFEKSDRYFADLSAEEQREERLNIRNGLNYAKKVLTTGECDMLILDEVLGILDLGIISADELKNLLEGRGDVEVILTGKVLSGKIGMIATRIDQIEHVQVDI
ncbi:MAG: cob(I)yrinic acid a,c-diamide adenosyltransferase [Brotaphodocola sp.]